jgi:uridine kinase
LKQLKQGQTVKVPVYDFKVHSRKVNEHHEEHPRTIIVVEGILIFVEPELRDLLDIKIFVDTDDDIRFIRRYVLMQYCACMRYLNLTFAWLMKPE